MSALRFARRASAVGTVGLAVLFGACSGGESKTSLETPDASAPASSSEEAAEVTLATALARGDQGLSSILDTARGGFQASGAWLASPGWRTPGPASVAARLSARADESFLIGAGPREDDSLRITRLAALPVEVQLHDGRAVYPGAFESADVVSLATEHRYEELVLLRGPAAAKQFAWKVELPSSLPRMTARPDGSVAVVDSDGEPVIVVPAPFLLDSAGTRRDAKLSVDGDRLVIDVSTDGLKFPVLLDPAFEVAIWTEVMNGGPWGRQSHMMAYDGSGSAVVLFGGYDASGQCPGGNYCNDTWTWNGTTWTGGPTGPSGRREAGIAYDETLKQIVLFGGFNGGYLGDTWVYKAGVWTQRCTTCNAGVNRPNNARGPSMAYDPGLKKVLLFGGNQGGTPFSKQMWVWNDASNNWTQVCNIGTCASNKPAGRANAVMSHDAQGKVMLFGGTDGTSYVSDTFIFDSTANNWSKVVTPFPLPRQQAGHAYDANRKRVVMFGGKGATGAMNDTWEWDGSAWTQLTLDNPSGLPTQRSAAMAFDASHRRVVMFSGDSPGGPSEVPDTQTYYVRGNACSPDGPSAACDTGYCVDSVCCETDKCGTCERCNLGQPSNSGVCTTVTNQDDDSCTGANTCDASGACKLKNGQTCTGGTQCASGICVDGHCCNVSCSGPSYQCKSCVTGACTTTITNQDDPNSCTGVNTCDASGACKKKLGQGCSNALECASGFCKDGTCCQSACTGSCLSCANVSGSCNAVQNQDDPDTCTGANTCNASGACKKKLGQVCGAATECVSNFCVDGRCCENSCAGAGHECKSCANGAGTCSSLVQNQEDPNSCSGASTCDGSGACKLKNGQTCVAGSQCASGSCQDGTCCADSCTTPCRSCANAAGTCTTVVTSGTDNNCSGTNICDSSGSCKLGAGQACSSASECATGNCVDGYCCNTACAGGCDVCAASLGATLNGTCTNLPKGNPGTGCNGFLCSGASPSCPTSCSIDTDCASTYYCAGNTCQPKKASGEACTAANQCGGSAPYCVDGVCCQTACTSPCMACAAALKQSLTNNGECGPAATGQDPHNDCTQDLPSSCGKTGVCDGSGGCALYPAQTACGATSCVGSSVKGKVCDGLGLCVTEANGIPCAPYLCAAGSCTSPCGTESDCVSGNYCEGGVCKPKVANGSACSTAISCQSGFCVDGVCCDSGCTQQCESCAVAGSEGQCKPNTGAPEKDKGTVRPACAGAGSACEGTCDGAKVDGCAYPGAATQCADSLCVNDSVQPPSHCDGTGQCAAPSLTDCGDYGCDTATGACKTSCTTNADCKGGAVCDTSNSTCTSEGATCADEYTVKAPNGTLSSCNGYKCVAGACQQQCAGQTDCAPGYDCQGTQCVKAQDAGTGGGGGGGGSGGGAGSGATSGASGSSADAGAKPKDESADDGGCGCRTAGDPRSGNPLWLGLMALGLGLVRGRRRSQKRSAA